MPEMVRYPGLDPVLSLKCSMCALIIFYGRTPYKDDTGAGRDGAVTDDCYLALSTSSTLNCHSKATGSSSIALVNPTPYRILSRSPDPQA